ncbi:MAG TPA: RNA methyltransferase [Mycobacteriales bacterium]|nr:RNA methyltransferase [Mycobacteriales bacterium]
MARVPAALREDRARAAGPARLIESIEDPADPRLADFRDLTDVALRTRFEPPHGLFIAESELVIRRALTAGYRPRSMVMAPEWLERMSGLIDDVDAPVFSASYDVLRHLTGFNVHRGALASFHRKPLPALDVVLTDARRLVVVEDIVSHTNLGAIFRCAAALGIDAVVLTPACADPLYRRSVRVSMGAVFSLPYARAESWPGALDAIKRAGFTTLALTPAADAVDLADLRYDDSARLALLLGTEGEGLSPPTLAESDVRVRIPMSGGVDSVNVAAAAAITFYVLGRPNRDLSAPGDPRGSGDADKSRGRGQ